MKAENCIFVQNKNKEQEEIKGTTYQFYTMLGEHDFIDASNKPQAKKESSKVVAKCTSKNGNNKFYIKIGTYGRIFNPIGLFSEGKNEKFIAKIGRKEFEFKEVNQKVFDLYLNFLSTKNIAWLNNAEREMV
jgi:hypothetical protein